MNTKRDSSFISAMSVLKRVQNFGVRVRFSSSLASVGIFTLDGKIEELSDKSLLLRGDKCKALVEWETSAPREVADLVVAGTEYSFILHFTLPDGDFFSVAGLDPLPAEPSGMLN